MKDFLNGKFSKDFKIVAILIVFLCLVLSLYDVYVKMTWINILETLLFSTLLILMLFENKIRKIDKK